MKFIIQPYNPSWPEEFQRVKASLETILNEVDYVSIEHVGSTSIPGMAAKPVIDIDIIVKPSSLVASRVALVGAGYLDMGEIHLRGQFQFRQPGYGRLEPALGEKDADGRPRRNTYVMIEGCLPLRNHLDVRRVLLEDADLREEYAAFKYSLADKDHKDVGAFAGAKTEIIWKILRTAGWSEEDYAPLRLANTK
ncbi:hypothetical protein BT63DRAFT_481418 [Microthyrium microscopicum]|uniref:Uncharacterized protein n=1 Tax=Microthyrium microscopicum TaxID=703497 RepID=A0A6A6U4X4_9PEZI|nr:hypothetical protein BT63DRAFT_481418 [Microthyrium microscopicum]